MQQILKVFIVLAFIVAVIATPVPMQKRQGTPKCPSPPDESTESDTYPVCSTGDVIMPYGCSPIKMQQIFKIFIALAFIIAVIATPVPIQKRTKGTTCPVPPLESSESDTYAVASDGTDLYPFDCS
ncbi:hypothetical protein GLOIN_2v1873907 [Rhizophagus clarus]|nr:hypothetical protein GLOIN_2v1873907 [Rhizophagus clarus]